MEDEQVPASIIYQLLSCAVKELQARGLVTGLFALPGIDSGSFHLVPGRPTGGNGEPYGLVCRAAPSEDLNPDRLLLAWIRPGRRSHPAWSQAFRITGQGRVELLPGGFFAAPEVSDQEIEVLVRGREGIVIPASSSPALTLEDQVRIFESFDLKMNDGVTIRNLLSREYPREAFETRPFQCLLERFAQQISGTDPRRISDSVVCLERSQFESPETCLQLGKLLIHSGCEIRYDSRNAHPIGIRYCEFDTGIGMAIEHVLLFEEPTRHEPELRRTWRAYCIDMPDFARLPRLAKVVLQHALTQEAPDRYCPIFRLARETHYAIFARMHEKTVLPFMVETGISSEDLMHVTVRDSYPAQR